MPLTLGDLTSAPVAVSLFGLLGVLAGVEEGVELNLMTLTFGVDVKRPALKLPIVGRVGFNQLPD